MPDVGNVNEQLVSETFFPPHSWITEDREIRFQLIYAAFEELLTNPETYFSELKNFELIVDWVLDDGFNPHSAIIRCVDGIFEHETSSYSINNPEADQALFNILKNVPFESALIKFRDSDILLTSLLAYKSFCSGQQKVHLQFLNKTTELIDLSLCV